MTTPMGRDLQNVKDDVLFAKRAIKEKLCKDSDIIEFLHNEELENNNADPEDYFGVNIFPYIRLPGTQDKVKNFVCFSVDDMEDDRYNDLYKSQYIQFVVFCHGDDIETKYGISRHDALGFIIRDIFNWSNLLGLQLKLVWNRESVLDNDYSCRTLKFEAIKPNMLRNGVAKPIPRLNDEVNSHGLIRS